jgi:D-alanyl-lipoteichoic acid acyltransferase DltB (MBOAT superfamily)
MIDKFLSDIQWAFYYSFEKPWFFTEYSFLLCFSIFLVGYAFLSKKAPLKLTYLILFSLFFYYKSSGPFLLLFMAIIICDFFLAQWLNKLQGVKRKFLLVCTLIYSLSFLLYFKYANFILININDWFHTEFTEHDLFLPIGISFYTFQSISYLVDVYRKEIPPSTHIIDYGFYMTFFPHLVAGPIVRAKDFLPQIYNPILLNSIIAKEALFRITIGLTKKLLIADYLAKYVDMLHEAPEGFSGFEHYVAMYAYAFQIYFDFSGYSDIAIGIALMLGYKLKENFDNPYGANNITVFWRKWHISLSLWLRDYIYIPLGGNRKGMFLMYVFLMTTMLIGGFWHGADWKFVFWGLGHGLLLVAHKLIFPKDSTSHWFMRAGGMLLTFHFVAFLWIFFRSATIDTSFESIRKIAMENNFVEITGFWLARPEVIILLALSALIVFFPSNYKQRLISFTISLPLYLWPFLILAVLQLIVQLRDNSIQPFIYFQF